MKKTVIILTMVLLAGVLTAQTIEIPQNGDGTLGNPYQIDNLNNLYWLSQNSGEWDKHFIQISSIDASDTQNWNGGEGFSPIGIDGAVFTGTYNGNYNSISDLYINRPDSGIRMQALFGNTSGANIQKLQLENVDITGWRNVGALIGFSSGTTVQNCSSSGSVTNTNDWAGGLIGYAGSSTIERCSSSCNVSGAAVGGLAGGTLDWCAVYDCYATGSVNGGIIKGGLIGNGGNSSVIRSYSTGYVSPGNWTGGLIGQDASASDCFWDVETSQMNSSSGGTAKITEDMQDVATYTDLITVGLNNPWDFFNNPYDDTANNDIWQIDQTLNSGYPILSWQISNADFTASSTEILLGETIDFTDLSVGIPATWAWDFDGDDITDSTIENPTWEYLTSGTYTVKLTITDGRMEDSETKIDYITVNEPSITEGLVAYYPFNENANDESGNANHGTVNGAALATDRFGNENSAYFFDGANDYIEVLDSPSLRPTNLTLSGWFNFSSVSPAIRSLIGKTVGSAWKDSYTMWRHNSMKGATGSESEFDELAYAHSTNPDEWYNIAYTYNDAGDTHSMFINGVLAATEDNFVSIGYDSHPLIIGADVENEVLSYFFHGLIDDVRIYDRALADVEIEMLYDEIIVPPVMEMTLVSDSSIDYGTIYYGLDDTQEVIIQNDGNVDLSVSDISFSSGGSSTFSYTYDNLGGSIAPGATNSIFVTFAPDREDSFSGTLEIINNSTNNPLFEIPLSGTGEYDEIPAPRNVAIVLTDGNAVISWDVITETVHGIPVTPDFYVINYNDDPNVIPDDYLHLAITTDLNHVHTGVVWYAEQMFYQVIAVRDYEGQYGRIISVADPIQSKITWREFKQKFSRK
jgi:PKD repeat protein